MESEAPTRKRHQRKACDTCRRRKVRCDVGSSSESACSSCQQAGIQCRSTTQWAKPRRHQTNSQRALGAEEVVRSETHLRRSPQQEPRDSSGNNNIGAGIVFNVGSSANHPSHIASAEPYTQNPMTSVLRQDHTPVDSDPLSRRGHFARGGLADFFKHGIDANVWAYFDRPDKFRVVYIGTGVSNLYHLVDLHQNENPHLSPADADVTVDSGCARGVAKALHYPHPPIRPARPWRPNEDISWLSSVPDLATEVASFPAPAVRDALVSAYFEHIHPLLPVISMPEFMEAYQTPEKPPPLLLLQAVLMAGAHACSHPLVAKDRHAVKSILFRRASLLYHTRHETNRIHLMQAATIFTWHMGDGDTVSGGPWYWSGIAVRLGCGLGTHRYSSVLPASETSQYRRCWWSAFVVEVMSCLETGRPCAVRPDDIDQLPCRIEDMTDGQDVLTRPTSLRGVDIPGLRIPLTDVSSSLGFLNHMVELAYIGLDIMAVNAPSQSRAVDLNGINVRLGRWSLQTGIFSAQKDDDTICCHLRMSYNLVLLHLYRNFESPESSTIRSTAAKAIVTSIGKLCSLSCLCQCQTTAVSAVTAAGIQLANEVRAATEAGDFVVVVHALDQLSRLLECAALLSEYWPNADAVHSVFHDLHEKYEAYAKQGGEGEMPVVPLNQLDWTRLFDGPQSSYPGNMVFDGDWLNTSACSELI